MSGVFLGCDFTSHAYMYKYIQIEPDLCMVWYLKSQFSSRKKARKWITAFVRHQKSNEWRETTQQHSQNQNELQSTLVILTLPYFSIEIYIMEKRRRGSLGAISPFFSTIFSIYR